MIDPFWSELSRWSPFPIDYMKPQPITDVETVKHIAKAFDRLNSSSLEIQFRRIADSLPLNNDEEPMTVAFYPSATDMPEGVVGSAAWGNIILTINPLTSSWRKWTLFVFAHEYHHNILGNYWYVQRRGDGLEGTLLETIINEGQADKFAMSLYPGMNPSWHTGIADEDTTGVWRILESVFYRQMSTEESAPYIFGSDTMEIPRNAGYYFGIRIVKGYMEKHPGITFDELLRTPHRAIFEESKYTLAMRGNANLSIKKDQVN
jgi:hypothetical protein